MEMVPQQYCLRWKHHHSNVQNMFAQLLEKERFCDVTLYCSPSFATQVTNKDTVNPQNIRGVSLRAHRVVLAACSELLGALLGAHEAHGEPVLVIDGAEPKHLRALLDYMYTGEMNVHHSQLTSLLKTAEELRIKGLTDIRWNNKDEPPDCQTGVVTTTTTERKLIPEPKIAERRRTPELRGTPEQRRTPERRRTPEQMATPERKPTPELSENTYIKQEQDYNESECKEKFNVNGGPPPLIKLAKKEKGNAMKREHSDTECASPKRQRMASGVEHTEQDNSEDDDHDEQEWQHGNMDISAERVVQWCGEAGGASWERDASDDEWADAPADIGSFLRTRLRVDGDDSADEESNDGAAASTSSSAGTSGIDLKLEHTPKNITSQSSKPTIGPKSGPTDPRFTDVVKLNDYLRYGRRPQFWEENYVKRVMEAVRLKELEMKQAAEILGVSYGTLYGRYRDVYGCINRPYRTARDFWQAKGPSDILDRLQRGELSLDAGANALGVTPSNLAAYIVDMAVPADKDFEPIPIEIDPSLKMKGQPFPTSVMKSVRKAAAAEKNVKKIVIGSITDEDPIPATVITTNEGKKPFNMVSTTTSASGKWPSIRVASLDSLRGSEPPSPTHTPADPTSPTILMRTRPDLTIVAAKKPDKKDDDPTT